MGIVFFRYLAWVLFIVSAWDVLVMVKSYEFYLMAGDYGYSWWEAIKITKIFWHLSLDALAFYLWWQWK